MKDAIRKLDSHVRQWVADGVISQSQGETILARYPEVQRNGWLIAYAIIGSVLCVAGVSLLIASNWQDIPSLVKLGGLLLLLAGATVVGVEAQHRGIGRSVWECGYLGASIFPLLGLALVSQIFHLSGPMSSLLATWFLAIAPLVLLSRSAAAFVVWIVAGYWWVGARLDPGWFSEWWKVWATYAGVGAGLAAMSQAWLIGGRKELRAIGEFAGVATVAFSLWMTGFDCHSWELLWVALFVGALGWIWLSMERGRIHQMNLGFVIVGLVIISFFFRLVGTMAHTGALFIGGGVLLLLTAWGLNRLRCEALRRMS